MSNEDGRRIDIKEKRMISRASNGMERPKALIINCSPVRTGATAEIVRIVAEQLSAKYSVKSICIDDYAFDFCKGI